MKTLRNSNSLRTKGTTLFTCAVFAGTAMLPSQAGASVIWGATEWTQILNNIQLVASYIEHVQQTIQQINMVKNQLDQYANMIQNTKSLASFDLRDLTGTLASLRTLYGSAAGLSYAVSNVESRYIATHKGYSDFLASVMGKDDILAQNTKWQSLHKETTVNALQAIKLQEDDFNDETTTINAIKSQLTTVDGAVKAINVGSEIATMNVQQLQMLRQLIMNQSTMHARYASIEEERVQQKAGQTKKLTDGTQAPTGNEKTF